MQRMAVMMNWTMKKSDTDEFADMEVYFSKLTEEQRVWKGVDGLFITEQQQDIFPFGLYWIWLVQQKFSVKLCILYFLPFKYLKETVLPGISKNISNNITRGIFMLLRNMVFHGSIKSTRKTHVFGFNDQYESLCPKRFEQWCLFWHFLQ